MSRPFDDDATGTDDGPLELQELGAHLGHRRDRTDVVGDRLGADRHRDVLAVRGDRRVQRVVAGAEDDLAAAVAIAAGSLKSTPRSISAWVSARNCAPVSR